MDGPPQQLDEISEIQKQISGNASNSNIHGNDRLFQYAQSETYDGNRVIKKIYEKKYDTGLYFSRRHQRSKRNPYQISQQIHET